MPKSLEENVRLSNVDKTIPFGSQYFERPTTDSPGKVSDWNWNPIVQVYVADSEAASWPGSTGTGPTAKEDERYGEAG